MCLHVVATDRKPFISPIMVATQNIPESAILEKIG